MARKRKVRAVGKYWGDEQDRAVIDYNNENDPRKKNQIFNLFLYEHLHAMASSILARYYHKHDKELVLDSISYVVEKAISKFDKANGKSFSFFQTVIKHYFYDELNPYTSKYTFVPIEEFDFESDSLPKQMIVEEHDSFEEERSTVLMKLKKNRGKKFAEITQKSLIDAILKLIDAREGYSTEYVTLFLMIHSNTNSQYVLRKNLDRLGVKLKVANIDRINGILAVHAFENGLEFTGEHDFKTIEKWQEHALNTAIRNKKYVLESI